MAAVVLDSNLAILLIVGITAKELIGNHRNLRAYSLDDFDCLVDLMQGHAPIIVSPNVLTEASNLCRQIAEPARSRISAAFSAFIAACTEEYVPSDRATENDSFDRLGLTDAVILEQMTASRLLLTADHALFVAAVQRRYTAINFNHVRPI
jgi:hypothetical protein